MALLGSRVPTALKLFLTTVAIVDDMGAVVIIALAYTASIKGIALLLRQRRSRSFLSFF